MRTIQIFWVAVYGGAMAGETGRGWRYQPWSGNSGVYSGETLGNAVVELPACCEIGNDWTGKACIMHDKYPCELGGDYKKPVIYTGAGEFTLKIISQTAL